MCDYVMHTYDNLLPCEIDCKQFLECVSGYDNELQTFVLCSQKQLEWIQMWTTQTETVAQEKNCDLCKTPIFHWHGVLFSHWVYEKIFSSQLGLMLP